MKIAEQSVELVDWMGSDISVVNAARVSFAKTSEFAVKAGFRDKDGGLLKDEDVRLINYLAKHNHWTPFGHTSITLRVKAPIFVARQLVKHQVGLVWNEVSRRYVDSEPEFYMPEYWRKKAANVKQGSSDEAVTNIQLDDTTAEADSVIEAALRHNLWLYTEMLNSGICAEQARMVLPQSMMTEWVWTGSVAAFARVCKLRLDPHTQKETREVAGLIDKIVRDKYPISWASLCT